MNQFEDFGMRNAEQFINESIAIGRLGAELKKMLEKLKLALDSGSPSEARMILRDHSDLLDHLRMHAAQAWQDLETIQIKIQESSEESARRFEQEFPRIAEESGLTFCQGTMHPVYLFDRSFLELRANLRNQSCILKTRGGREQNIGIEPEIIVKEIKAQLDRLHNRNLTLDQVRSQIIHTYTELNSARKNTGGDGVRLKEFVKAYQKNHRAAVDETIIDLSNAFKNFSELKLDYIRDHEDGYQLYGFEEHGYYGFLRVEGQ